MVKKIVESEFENIQDVFEFNKIHPIVIDNNNFWCYNNGVQLAKLIASFFFSNHSQLRSKVYRNIQSK